MLKSRMIGTSLAIKIRNIQLELGLIEQQRLDFGKQQGGTSQSMRRTAWWEWGRPWCFIKVEHLMGRNQIGSCMSIDLRRMKMQLPRQVLTLEICSQQYQYNCKFSDKCLTHFSQSWWVKKISSFLSNNRIYWLRVWA